MSASITGQGLSTGPRSCAFYFISTNPLSPFRVSSSAISHKKRGNFFDTALFVFKATTRCKGY